MGGQVTYPPISFCVIGHVVVQTGHSESGGRRISARSKGGKVCEMPTIRRMDFKSAPPAKQKEDRNCSVLPLQMGSV
jgi:hypothetical protein